MTNSNPDSIITPAGLDLGNRVVNLVMAGRKAKIPACYSTARPMGRINPKTGNRLKERAVCAEYKGQMYWFGPDVLSDSLARNEIDEFKYDPEYITILWLGVLAWWQKQHKISPSELGQITVVAGMPAQPYAGMTARRKAEAAYRKGLRSGKTGRKDTRLTLGGQKFDSKLLSVAPEAACYGRVRSFNSQYMLVFDMGGGTDDSALFEQGNPQPISVKTVPGGLVNLYAQQALYPAQAELAYLDKQGNADELAAHIGQSRNRLAIFARKLPDSVRANMGLTIIGGGAVLGNGVLRNHLSKVFDPLVVGDEYENARMFEAIAKEEVARAL